MSKVSSVALKDGKRVEPAQEAAQRLLDSLTWRAAGLAALTVGGVFWLLGARFTVLGGPRTISAVAGLFGIATDLQLPSGYPLLWLTILVGAVFSLIEFGAWPRRRFFAQSLGGGLLLLLLWAGANLSDWVSTYNGVQTISPTSWPITIWIAKTRPASIAWSSFLTWAPEGFIITGFLWLLKGRF